MKKTNYQKLKFLGLAFLFAISLVACSNNNNNDDPTDTPDQSNGGVKTEVLSNFFNEIPKVSTFADYLGQIQDNTLTDNPGSGSGAIERIGQFRIPKIGVNYPIAFGSTQRVLLRHMGLYETSASIGQKGNVVITGHRGTDPKTYLYRLDELTTGDLIYVKNAEGTEFTYVVTEKFVVDKYAMWVTYQSNDYRLTIITCTPIGSYEDRLIVVAQLVQ